jgi:subtilisin family serine protease
MTMTDQTSSRRAGKPAAPVTAASAEQAGSGPDPAAGTAGAEPLASEGQPDPAQPPRSPARVGRRHERYMISVRSALGPLQPMSVDTVHETLTADPDVKVVRRLKPRGMGLLSTGSGAEGGHIVVAHIPLEKAESMRAGAHRSVVIERDHLLRHHAPDRAIFALLEAQWPIVGQPQQVTASVAIKVVGPDGRPVPSAMVMVYGQDLPAQGTTDSSGEVVLTVAGGPIETVLAIFVKPSADFWNRIVMRPQLVAGQSNVVELKRLSDTFAGFPAQGMMGWGQKIMGLDRIDPRFRGAGIKIGIIDSGCDNTHPQLRHVTQGADLVLKDDGAGWTNDEMAHGTHCAGIIGAVSDDVPGIAGFAPAAEIHALKVFPGGHFSDLIDALDVAMDRRLDVVNMSLGTDEPSELVQHKLAAAVAAGTACIVATGNSAGPVQFPGIVPQAIAVGAVGDLGQYPEDSDHAHALPPEGAGANGLFAAKFSCFGPPVRLCAPGVAIVSTVPGGGYAAWDGTSMATPHVTGLAALLLAHHPRLQGVARTARVAALWELLRSCATAVVPDPMRGGAGLPSVPAPLLRASAQTESVALSATSAPYDLRAVAAGRLTPEAILLELCSNPAILQTVVQRTTQLKAAGLI